MSDYQTNPLKVCALATGGADVDVSATLFVDDMTDQDGDATLTDVHKGRKCASIKARAKSGVVKLRLLLVVVPLVGNGQFEVAIDLDHPDIPSGPRRLTLKGDVADGKPKPIARTFTMP